MANQAESMLPIETSVKMDYLSASCAAGKSTAAILIEKKNEEREPSWETHGRTDVPSARVSEHNAIVW